MTKQGKFEKIYAHELMLIAEQDLESARALASVQGGRPENIFLLAQQGLEKALKALLCWREQPIPFVHDIGVLVAKLEAQGLDIPFGYELNGLSEFATIRRYTEGKEQWTTEDIDAVLTEVGKAIVWCQTQLSQV